MYYFTTTLDYLSDLYEVFAVFVLFKRIYFWWFYECISQNQGPLAINSIDLTKPKARSPIRYFRYLNSVMLHRSKGKVLD